MKPILVILFIISIAYAKPWNSSNNPSILLDEYESSFAKLPLIGEYLESKKGWPSYYWPYNKGGVGFRWQMNENAYLEKFYSLSELKTFSKSKLSLLSPIEKLDILNQDYNYTSSKMARKYSNQNASDWNGICHGMAAASLHFDEPQISSVTTEDGLEVELYTSDIKALLGLFYAINEKSRVRQLGERCFFNNSIMTRLASCKDVNAGSFHLVLTNLIGIRGESLLLDINRYKEVWNHPVLKYESTLLVDKKNRKKIETIISIPRTMDPHFSSLLGSTLDYLAVKKYVYWLDLNSQDEIVGGSWVSFERPDFLWLQNPLDFDMKFQVLSKFID